jgi:archaellum biogenesis ATPase FlaH
MTYRAYLKKVEDLLVDPLPTSPEDSISTWNQVGVDTQVEIEEPLSGTKIPGFNHFNEVTWGIRPHEFTIGSGPTGCGKTTLLTNWAYLLAESGTPVMVGSIETGKNDFHRVMAGIAANKNPYRGWSRDQIKSTFQASPVLRSERNIHLNYASRVNHRRLLADILYAVDKYRTEVVFIDNLNFLLDIKDSRDQITAVDNTIHDFVVFTKKVPVHVVMIMHPNKDGILRVEHEGQIKGSTTAVQEAANIFVWNRLAQDSDAGFNKEPQWCRELMFRKVRKNGRAVGSRIIYSVDRDSPRLTEEKFL